ncbi:MAG: two-component regulator propeller domain-containing protein [Bacteroidales bacterium]
MLNRYLSKIYFLIILLFAFFAIELYASNDLHYRMTHLSVNAGLPHHNVTSVVQDNYGFTWIGTNDGLVRYDGYKFKQYRQAVADTASLQDNRVICIYFDSKQNLWVATEGGGLHVYNYDRDNFQNFRIGTFPQDNHIYSLYEDSEKALWVGSTDGIFRIIYDQEPRHSIVRRILSGNPQIDNIFTICQTKYKKEILFGTDRGLYILNPLKFNNGITKYKQPSKISMLGDKTISSLLSISFDRILVGTADGLYLYEDQNSVKELTFSGCVLKDIQAICMVSDSVCIIGTYQHGIYQLTYGEKEFLIRRIQLENNTFIEQSRLKSLYADKMSNIWVGTTDNGMGYFNLSTPRFNTRFKNQDGSCAYIVAFRVAQDKRLWIQQRNQVLRVYEQEKSTPVFSGFQPFARTIFEDKNHNIWIAGKKDLYRLPTGARLPLEAAACRIVIPDSLADYVSEIRDLKEDQYGHIWIGCKTGVLLIKQELAGCTTFRFYHKFKAFVRNINITKLYFEPEKHQVWVCSKDYGLFLRKYNQHGDLIEIGNYADACFPEQSLNSNHVWSIKKSRRGDLWVGTDCGLNRIEKVNGIYQIQTPENISSLKNKRITSILEDKSGFLWLTCGEGLVRFSPESGSVDTYSEEDGLTNSALVGESQLDEAGNIYVGSIDGITYFNPDKIEKNQFKPQVVITGFKVFNKEIKAEEKINGRVLLKKSILKTDQITLKHTENNFLFEFAGIHYNKPNANRYAYKLEGYDKDWVYSAADNRTAAYNNLKVGTYTFCIKAANSDQIWSDKIRKVQITILPAPWFSGWAYMGYTLFLLFVLFVVFRYYRKQAALKYKLKVFEIKRLHDQELAEVRMRFHTNITHEIRTPLTLITAPLQDAINLAAGNEHLNTHLQLIKRNADRLSGIVNQFLDLHKIDKAVLGLKINQTNIRLVLTELAENFKPYFLQKHISFELEIAPLLDTIWADEDKVIKIVSNLLSNAVKFTNYGGQIRLEVEEIPDRIRIVVTDNGVGISEQELPSIFDRFFQAGNNKEMGSGIGLSLVHVLIRVHHCTLRVTSNLNQGSVFSVELPIKKEFYASHEIYEKESVPVLSRESVVMAEETVEARKIILVIEDDNDMRLYLQSILSDEYTVLAVDNAQDGYKKGVEAIPDLIITDLTMPGMDGLELCRALKSNFHTSHIPILILTGMSAEKDITAGYKAGAEVYVTKPFDPERLIIQVKNMTTYRKKEVTELQSKAEEEEDLHDGFNEQERKFITMLTSCIEENMDSVDYTIEDICREIGTSRMQLHRKLSALMGQSTSEFIRNYKINRAKELLESGNYNVTEVIYKVGFKSNSHFSKTFKEIHGILPSELLR